ncbi:hypothetical protein K504DRAFT_456940 [Pleomassaria siparia CBS 279.74]|uniref:Uncharacterized protein n=1 Tax=Pleomassaria siparia CBS 279.74 TaxID=1314801 RepID=A0A6G1KQZ3_9PLEO|nr:hypothetical protein K504DRAFT_456940 [Pleomassaria siparia CBS 279.74]
MARTKYTPLFAANKKLYPQSGGLSQRPLNILWGEMDLETYPLRARIDLVDETLPSWKNREKRRRALKGLSGRTETQMALRPGFEGVRKREVMIPREAAKVRKLRKLMRVGEPKTKEIGVMVSNEGEGKWVVGVGARRALGLGRCDVEVGEGANKKKTARELKKETEFWGGYREMQISL